MNTRNQIYKNRTQSGFTLLELLVGIAIASVILPAVGVGIYQITRGSQSSNDRMTAINNVQRAGEYISLDVRQSQISLDYGNVTAPGFPLNITWTDYGALDSNRVQYDYSNSTQTLTRSYFVPSGNTTATSTIVVARSITGISCTPIKPEGEVITVELTVNSTFTDSFTRQQTGESRTYEIRPRTLD